MAIRIGSRILLVRLVVITIIMTFFHIRYTADAIASISNYFVALGVLPVVFGTVVGLLGALYASRPNSRNFKSFYYLPVVCGLASVIPVIYVVLVISFASM